MSCLGKEQINRNGNACGNKVSGDKIVTKKIVWKNKYSGMVIADSVLVIMPCIFKIKDDILHKIVCYENGLNDSIGFVLLNNRNTTIDQNITIMQSDTEVYERGGDSIKIYGHYGDIGAEISDYALIDLTLRPSSALINSASVDHVTSIKGSLKGSYSTLNLCLAILQNLTTEKPTFGNSITIKCSFFKNGTEESKFIYKSKIDLHNYINILNYFIQEKALYK